MLLLSFIAQKFGPHIVQYSPSAHRAIFSVHVLAGVEIVHCTFRIQRQIELVFPTELITRLAQGIVADLCAGMSLGQRCSFGVT